MAILSPATPTVGDSTSPRFALTYDELRGRLRGLLNEEGRKASYLANFFTAFNGWLKQRNLRDASLVGDELLDGFDAALLSHDDWLTEEGRSVRTKRDRLEFIVKLRTLFLDVSRVDGLPPKFRDALHQLLERDNRSKAAIAREAGIPIQTLDGWLAERRAPRRDSTTHVLNLETALGLPTGTLIGRLDTQSYFVPKRNRSCQTEFGRRMSKVRLSKERVRIQPTPRLRAQWLALLRFKIDVLRAGVTARNLWRVKPPHRTGTKPDWSMLVDGRVCTSGGLAWQGISGFLGWLTLPEPGGEGMSIEQADTLAWLVDAERVLKHTAWKVARADGVFNNGALTLLRGICSHLRPQTGFLWQRPALAASLPRDFILAGRAIHTLDGDALCAAWQEACKQAREIVFARVQAVTSSGHVRMSRLPKEPIQSILSDAQPLRVILEMVRTMEHLAPPKHQARVFHAWLRDLLLIKMLCTNPLRVSQFAVMTYRVDNSGNLYQTNQGDWRLRYKGVDFKNERGAARDDYDVGVPRTLWATIQRYLSEARPHLHGADACDFVFLPTVSNASEVDKYGDPIVDRQGMWNADAISSRVYELTAKYLPGVPPFHGHAMRHIVATDYLKRVPGDYPTVARLLHDKLVTVLRAYAQYEVDAGLRRLHAYVESIWGAPGSHAAA